MMRGVHDKARVHVALGIMALSAFGMFVNAVIGKRNARQGDSLEKRMLDYQAQYNARKEQELASSKH